jgi:hypothetical protein
MPITTPDWSSQSDSPTPVQAQPDLNIPEEAYGARTAARWLEPGQQLDPMSLAEISRVNSTRAQELENQYLGRQQEILSTGPEAYFNKRGRDALLGADDIVAKLEAARQETLGQAANPMQRGLLKRALDRHGIAAQYDIGTHVGRQSLAWQQEVANGRLANLIEQAGFAYADPDRIKAYATESIPAALDRAWTSGLATDSDEALAQAEAARSAVVKSAIEGALAKGDNQAAIGLYDEIGAPLSANDRAIVAQQIDGPHEDREEVNAVLRNSASSTAQLPANPAFDATDTVNIDRSLGDLQSNMTPNAIAPGLRLDGQAASIDKEKHQSCVERCYHILERRRWGDRNQWDYFKCYSQCMSE